MDFLFDVRSSVPIEYAIIGDSSSALRKPFSSIIDVLVQKKNRFSVPFCVRRFSVDIWKSPSSSSIRWSELRASSAFDQLEKTVFCSCANERDKRISISTLVCTRLRTLFCRFCDNEKVFMIISRVIKFNGGSTTVSWNFLILFCASKRFRLLFVGFWSNESPFMSVVGWTIKNENGQTDHKREQLKLFWPKVL